MTSDSLMDLSSLSRDAVEELHREGCECLSGTVTLAIAADARATTLIGIFGGAALALLAACATILAGPSAVQYHQVLVASVPSITLLFVAAFCCAMASRPSDFYVSGYEPKLIYRSASDVTWMLRYAIADVQSRIDANRDALAYSARLVSAGMLLAVMGVILSVLVYFIA